MENENSTVVVNDTTVTVNTGAQTASTEVALSIKTRTIIRLLVLLLAITNQVLLVIGKSPIPIDSALAQTLLTELFLIGASAWAAWKNNSISKAALIGDAAKDLAKMLEQNNKEGE